MLMVNVGAGATGNDQTAIGAETAKLELENEAEELRQNVSALNDEVPRFVVRRQFKV